MTRRIVIVLGLVLCGTWTAGRTTEARSSASDVVEIRMNGRYFVEPANVRVMLAVDPHASNRVLRVEADGDAVFRASEIELDGAHAQRLHAIVFKGLPAGRYVLRAEVRSAQNVRGMDQDEVLVIGKPEGP